MAIAAPPAEQPPAERHPVVTVIEPARGTHWPNFRELWHYRDTLYFLARRDVAVRYKQTVIGLVWVILQPVAFALVYTAFLSLIGSVPSQGAPYGVFALTGMTIWLFFGVAMARVSDSTVASTNLIQKIWFPRLIIPVAAVGPALVDLVASSAVLGLAMLVFGVMPAPKIVFVPFAALIAMLSAFGIGLWFSAIAVRYRDIQQLVPFLMQVLLFATPIIYPFELVPKSVQTLYSLNPLVGMVETWRWAILPGAPFPGTHLLITLVFIAIIVPTGLVFYERRQHLFADVI
jgi:lipopolysaccharide transport system permease protein